jgi:hypothetical protein
MIYYPDICEKCEVLYKLMECKDNLLTCYRIGKRPSGKLLDSLSKYSKQLDKIEVSDSQPRSMSGL